MSIRGDLNLVIKSINDFSKTTNIIAINAAIYANKLGGSDGAPFQVLAREIQTMNVQSVSKLKELDGLVDEIAALSKLINKTGGQRMLLMRIVVGVATQDSLFIKESIKIFAARMAEIEDSSINSPVSLSIIQDIRKHWVDFNDKLDDMDSEHARICADKMILDINRLIGVYERYAGVK